MFMVSREVLTLIALAAISAAPVRAQTVDYGEAANGTPPAQGDTGAYDRTAVARFNQGVEYQQSGQLRRAIAEYKAALVADPRMEEAYANLGIVYTELEDFTRAEEALGAALQLSPARPKTLNALGVALFEHGRLNEAEGNFRRAIALDPRFASAHYNLAMTAEKNNDYRAAYVSYSRVLKIDPEQQDARQAVARVAKTMIESGGPNAFITPVADGPADPDAYANEDQEVADATCPALQQQEEVPVLASSPESAVYADFQVASQARGADYSGVSFQPHTTSASIEFCSTAGVVALPQTLGAVRQLKPTVYSPAAPSRPGASLQPVQVAVRPPESRSESAGFNMVVRQPIAR